MLAQYLRFSGVARRCKKRRRMKRLMYSRDGSTDGDYVSTDENWLDAKPHWEPHPSYVLKVATTNSVWKCSHEIFHFRLWT
jgi:hypothetical protein